METAQSYVSGLISDLGQQTFTRNMALTPMQWKKQLISNSENVMSSFAKLQASISPNGFDKMAMERRAAEIATNLADLIAAARNAAAIRNGEEDVDLLDGAKRLADAVRELLASSKDLADHPDDQNAVVRWEKAQSGLQAATAFLQTASRGLIADEASQKLLAESAKGVKAALEDLIAAAHVKADSDPTMKAGVDVSAKSAINISEKLGHEVNALAPAIMSTAIRMIVEGSVNSVQSEISKILESARFDGELDVNLAMAAKAVSDALAQLLASTKIAEAKDTSPDFASAAKDILDETARLMAARTVEQISSSKKVILQASSKLVTAAKQTAETSNEEGRLRLHTCARAVAEAAKRLIEASDLASGKFGQSIFTIFSCYVMG